MAVQRKADAVWEGDLLRGKGTVKVASGAFAEFPVTWASRTEKPDNRTSPEELLAAAHSSCYAMALSATLARRGTPPQKLNVSATCTFDKVGDSWKVTTIELSVIGKVPGLDQARFEDAAKAGEKACPISNAIRGNVDIRLSAKLQ